MSGWGSVRGGGMLLLGVMRSVPGGEVGTVAMMAGPPSAGVAVGMGMVDTPARRRGGGSGERVVVVPQWLAASLIACWPSVLAFPAALTRVAGKN